MTDKERKILDKEIQYLSEQQDRVKAIRQYTRINPGYTFQREAETIESLYKSVLENRKLEKSSYFSCATSGWHVVYLRDMKTYKEGEKFRIKIFHTFAYTENSD
jgi:hypothetical protein